jgi:hypothetical protein
VGSFNDRVARIDPVLDLLCYFPPPTASFSLPCVSREMGWLGLDFSVFFPSLLRPFVGRALREITAGDLASRNLPWLRDREARSSPSQLEHWLNFTFYIPCGIGPYEVYEVYEVRDSRR